MRVAIRSLCSSRFPRLVFVLTKNVRDLSSTESGEELRGGMAMAVVEWDVYIMASPFILGAPLQRQELRASLRQSGLGLSIDLATAT